MTIIDVVCQASTNDTSWCVTRCEIIKTCIFQDLKISSNQGLAVFLKKCLMCSYACVKWCLWSHIGKSSECVYCENRT